MAEQGFALGTRKAEQKQGKNELNILKLALPDSSHVDSQIQTCGLEGVKAVT